MTENKKISKEHLQTLLNNYERDEKVNFYLMFYTFSNIFFIGIFYLLIDLLLESFLIYLSMFLIIYLSYRNTKSFNLQLKGKKNQIMVCNLKLYLITGKMKKDSNLENALEKLKLTESQYKISQLVYFSYFLIFISIELFILSLFNKIGILLNPLNYGIVFTIGFSVELGINFVLLFFQILRYMIFKNIREIREFLDEMLVNELTKIQRKIEGIMDLKLSEFRFNRARLLKYLRKWSDLYIGSHFIGLRKQLLISDYKNLMYSFGNEVYYHDLFKGLKYRIEESQYFNSTTKNKSRNAKLNAPINDIIELNIKRLNASIQSRILVKNESRNKIKITQTWIAIVGIIISIIFSISKLPSLFGL